MSRAKTLLTIAKTHLHLDTLDTRKSDGLDFSDQAVWAIKAALEAAYEAGRAGQANKGVHRSLCAADLAVPTFRVSLPGDRYLEVTAVPEEEVVYVKAGGIRLAATFLDESNISIEVGSNK